MEGVFAVSEQGCRAEPAAALIGGHRGKDGGAGSAGGAEHVELAEGNRVSCPRLPSPPFHCAIPHAPPLQSEAVSATTVLTVRIVTCTTVWARPWGIIAARSTVHAAAAAAASVPLPAPVPDVAVAEHTPCIGGEIG